MNDTQQPRREWDGRLSQVEAGFIGVLLVVSLAIVLCQVAARVLFDHPLTWTDEAARLCLVWLTFVGAGHLMAQGRHLAVDALVRRLPRRARLGGEVASNVVVVGACGVVLLTGFGFVTAVARSTSPALTVSVAWFYGAAITGLTLVIAHAATNTVRAVRRGHALYGGAADDVVDDVAALESGSGGSTADAVEPQSHDPTHSNHVDGDARGTS